MINHTKKQVLLSTIVFSILLISCLNSPFLVPVSAVDCDAQNKTMEILTDIIGLNAKNCSSLVNSIADEQFRNLAQKEIDVKLVSVDGSVRVKTSFVNNILRQIYISNYQGDFAEEKSVSETTESAKNFLKNYRNYAGDSLYNELSSMLDDVDATKNTTKTTDNIHFEVFNTEQKIVEYVWTYMDENGIKAQSKNVVLSYENGLLNVFLNNWPLYTVVGTSTISGEEATAIAIEESKTFAYDVRTANGTSTITGFSIAPESLGHETLSYQNFPNQTLARGGNSFILYPSWYVPIGFTQSYPGAVTGITVTVWADTGEVSSTNPMIVNFPASNSAEAFAVTNEINLHPLVISIVVATLSAFGAFMNSRTKNFKFVNNNVVSKFFGTLLFGTIIVSSILVTTSTATAIMNPDSKAEIYAAYYGNPDQLESEITGAEYVAAQIKADFETSGYTASKWTGDGTTVSGVLGNATYDEDNYDRVAIFHFGHQYSWNRAYQSNDGTPIWDTAIDGAIDSQKHEFVFIWVCAQANFSDYGTPEAWTQRTNLSDNGYSSPDYSGQAYLGFANFSLPINNSSVFEGQTTGPVLCWIEDFYDYALCDCNSIRDAMNLATQDFFGTTFTLSILNTGYSAWYPGDEYGNGADYYYGKMRLFGDGTMVAYQPTLTVSAGIGGYVSPSGTNRYTYGHNALATAHAYANYEFSYWTLDGQYYSSTYLAQVTVDDDHSLHAVFTYSPDEIPVTIQIYSVPDDGYSRYHAFTVDNDIPTVFWTGDWYNQNPDAIIAITGSTLNYQRTFYVTEGYHTIEYAVSSAVGYEWYATITVNSQVVAQQYTNRYNQVSAQIYVNP